MTTMGVCRVLDWDSKFFGCRIARVESSRLGPEELREVRAFTRKEAVDCLYYLCDANDVESIRTAENAGFQCMDVRVTRERGLEEVSRAIPPEVEEFQEPDLPALRAIARSSHGATRFYHDPHFPRERCDALYETWIANACAGRAERVLVVRRAGLAVGYLTCEMDSPTLGQIGLVAVAERERGRGLGEALVLGALSWFAGRGCERVRVVSQARNLSAGRLYERQGFRTTRTERWYHLWPDEEMHA